MEYSDKNLTDLMFTAMRFSAAIDRKCLEELSAAGAITDYRDLCVDIDKVKEIAEQDDISERTSERLKKIVNEHDDIRRRFDGYLKIASDNDIKIISSDDPEYPWAWKQLSGMPPVFFCKGNTDLLKKCYTNGAAAMVGSREPSYYGKQATVDYAEHFAERDVVTVSGMATGIDRIAHSATLNKGGDTIAILPGGVDVIYPQKNQDLYDAICNRGLALSEMPPGQAVLKQYFPARNRLISGLADITMIMEAGQFSGTLHTASYAASQGKDLFVLPHGIYSANAIGGLYLIRDGAEVIIDKETIDDRIAECLVQRLGQTDVPGNIEDLRKIAEEEPDRLGEAEWKAVIMDRLTAGPKSFDELSGLWVIDFSKLSVLLQELEGNKLIGVTEGKYSLTFQR